MRGMTHACAGLSLVLTGALIVTTTGPATATTAASDLQNASNEKASPFDMTDAIAIPGSSNMVRAWTDRDGTEWAAISKDGRQWNHIGEVDNTLHLRYGDADPLFDAMDVPDVLKASVPSPDAAAPDSLYIVQFVTQPLQSYRDGLAEAGATIRKFLPSNAYIVQMTDAQRADVEALPYVRWVGNYHVAYKLEDYIIERVVSDEMELPTLRYYLMMSQPTNSTKLDVADRMEALGAVVDQRISGKLIMSATLNQQQLLEVANWPEILWINRWGEIEGDMNNAREAGGANHIETVAGYTGQGVHGEVLDLGFNVGHVDFAAQPLIQHDAPVASDGHGASTSGIIFGDGTGNAIARGMVPDAQGIVSDTNGAFDFPGRYTHEQESLGAPYFSSFHSSSVGHPRTFFYEAISAEMDQMLFDFDILHCQSQSNAGNQDSRPEAWAKNIVSVGAFDHFNTLDRSDDCWSCGNGSIGPASDGRIKPDLSSYYDAIDTITCCGSTSYTTSFGGTSGATPITAGHFGLLMQMWGDGIFGNVVDPGGTVFENRPHMTTAKALMINTADQYFFNGLGHDMTRVHQGWGTASVGGLYDLRDQIFVVNETDVLENLESITYQVIVAPGEPAVRFTMTYADPPAAPGASVHRINDVSMKVTSPTGAIYHGNVGLEDFIWSDAGGSPNTIDTVENVFVENPTVGAWTVEITAAEVNEDGHVETPGLDVDFALVVSGVEQILPPVVILPDAPPALIAPDEETIIQVLILDGEEVVIPATAALHYRFDASDPFTEIPMQWIGGEAYWATIPPAACDDTPQFYYSVQGDGGTTVTSPATAPDDFFTIDRIGVEETLFEDDFGSDMGWEVTSDPGLLAGEWERGDPVGGGLRGDPEDDFDGAGSCYLTGNAAGDSDVDGGATTLISPTIDLSGLDEANVSIAIWYTNNFGADPHNDLAYLRVSNNNGLSWVEVEELGPITGNGWNVHSFDAADFVALTANMKFSFEVSDLGTGSVVEGGFDAFSIKTITCEDTAGCPEDIAGDDNVVNTEDLLLMLSSWGACPGCPADITGDDTVNTEDLLQLLAAWGDC